jgi:hypothetical protein
LVGLQTLDLAILVRVQVSQPKIFNGLRETQPPSTNRAFNRLSPAATVFNPNRARPLELTNHRFTIGLMAEWTIPFDDEESLTRLCIALHPFEQEEEPGPRSDKEYAYFMVGRFAGLKIIMFSREHPPPHFRVMCGGESADYRISDCEQLEGGLRKHYKVIREWHAENKPKLIEVWNKTRPTDCPVGPYRE